MGERLARKADEIYQVRPYAIPELVRLHAGETLTLTEFAAVSLGCTGALREMPLHIAGQVGDPDLPGAIRDTLQQRKTETGELNWSPRQFAPRFGRDQQAHRLGWGGSFGTRGARPGSWVRRRDTQLPEGTMRKGWRCGTPHSTSARGPSDEPELPLRIAAYDALQAIRTTKSDHLLSNARWDAARANLRCPQTVLE